jgi:hypothetical protein
MERFRRFGNLLPGLKEAAEKSVSGEILALSGF